MKQKSILHPCTLSGIGLHSGDKTTIVISPASANAGVSFFQRGEEIPALISQIKQTKRGTTLGKIAVVEHLLAAVFGLGIDNLHIEVQGNELPALDGSAAPYVKALQAAGIVELAVEKTPLILEQPIKIIDEESSLEAIPSNGFSIDFMVNFPGVGEQRFSYNPQNQHFDNEIAPARTFGYFEEYETLKKQGLGLGAGYENTLILGKDGYLNTPRFPDEIVRHKILDLIGDLSLLGRPLQAKIKAFKSGHRLNTEFVRRLVKA